MLQNAALGTSKGARFHVIVGIWPDGASLIVGVESAKGENTTEKVEAKYTCCETTHLLEERATSSFLGCRQTKQVV
jgi:hypothetical protein